MKTSTPLNITIERATTNDAFDLMEISKTTFVETFGSENTSDDMAKYLYEKMSKEQLSDELNNPNSEFYFAKDNDEIIGYLKLNFKDAQTELQDNQAVEIERIYVLKAYHSQKIGQLLYEKALEIANEKNTNYIWLGVWEENKKAIRFYEKNGFTPFSQHIFKLGNEEQTDILMKLNLTQK